MEQMIKRKNFCVITGSRADYGILSHFLKELQRSKYFQLKVIVTCMHLIPKYGNTYKEILKDKIKIYKKIKLPLKGDKIIDISNATGVGIKKYSEALSKIKPDFVIILGDRFEALAFAIASLFLKIPIIHIHGGESTSALIDDSIRHSITKMSNIHFVSNEFYKKRIINMGEDPKSIYTLGSLALDNMKKIKYLSKKEIEKKLNFKFDETNLLVTIHPETLGKTELINNIDSILKKLTKLKKTKIIFTMPNVDMGNINIFNKLKKFVRKNKSKSLLLKSMGQQLYFSSLNHIDVVIGNSSSGIIEAPSFRVPTINLGKRQLGRLKPKSVINCDFNSKKFEKSLKKSLSKRFKRKINKMQNPYYKPNTINNMLKILKKIKLKNGTQKIFYEK